MSVMKTMDKTSAALERGKTKIVKVYDFMRGLSVKNKASFDIQVKSDKCFAPLCRHSFGYNKEFRVMPIVLSVMGVMTLFAAIKIACTRD